MNKILVKDNKVFCDNNDIFVDNNNIKFNKSGIYNLEYFSNGDNVINIEVNNCDVTLLESSFDNEIDIHINYEVNNGSLCINKFYNNKNVKEELIVNLNRDNDSISYNFSNICSGSEEYIININHNAKNTKSNISNKAVALKNSKLHFVINSKVNAGCIDSVLNQNTRIVTMGECDTKICPNMFIDLDMVEAKHGSVIGTFKEDEIFYLMSKGISYNETIQLLIKGYILGNISVNSDVRKNVMNIIDMYWR